MILPVLNSYFQKYPAYIFLKRPDQMSDGSELYCADNQLPRSYFHHCCRTAPARAQIRQPLHRLQSRIFRSAYQSRIAGLFRLPVPRDLEYGTPYQRDHAYKLQIYYSSIVYQ